MRGAIAGDVIGSPYEVDNIKTVDFPLFREQSRFTDDTVLTVALADWLLHGGDWTQTLHDYGNRYPRCGFGGAFKQWIAYGVREPYNSWGNGSAMRVSPVAWAFDDLETVMDAAEASAQATHNHPDGIKGAQAIAACVFLARMGTERDVIREFVQNRFAYDLDFTLDSIRPTYHFDVSCRGSVPQAVVAFCEGQDFEDAVRKAISIGGDSDTIASMAGAIAEAYFGGVPRAITIPTLARLDAPLRSVVDAFCERFALPVDTE